VPFVNQIETGGGVGGWGRVLSHDTRRVVHSLTLSNDWAKKREKRKIEML
jgi:hypothetical protein